MTGIADVHAHLTHSGLREQVPAIVQRAAAAGVSTIISNGLNPSDNQAVRELARQHSAIKPAFGFYPVDTVLAELLASGADYPREDAECTREEGIAFVREHAAEAIAIGEIGLDGYWVPEALWGLQEEAFGALVRVAMDAGKPIIVHTRKREKRTFEILRELGIARVNWHCFGGKVKLAREIAEHGHYLFIPANARRSQSFTRMLETLPRDRVLLETDCPYLSPEPGSPSEPANVADTARYAAEIWKTDEASVRAQIAENFERLFGIAP
ncbi:MAG TPA: TatD family hydrolase [Polyangiales bacterium]|nr:TatD family hydrolase [Polyangiales bacterium]